MIVSKSFKSQSARVAGRIFVICGEYWICLESSQSARVAGRIFEEEFMIPIMNKKSRSQPALRAGSLYGKLVEETLNLRRSQPALRAGSLPHISDHCYRAGWGRSRPALRAGSLYVEYLRSFEEGRRSQPALRAGSLERKRKRCCKHCTSQSARVAGRIFVS